MYWLIESSKQLEILDKLGYNKGFIEIIPTNHFDHPKTTEVSLVYIRPIESNKAFVLCLNHNDTLSLKYEDVFNYLKKYEILYCRNKKDYLYYFTLNNLYDVDFIERDFEETDTFKYYKRELGEFKNFNVIYPVVKHYEYYNKLYDVIKPELYESKYRDFFNNKVAPIFYFIEKNGVCINKEVFNENFYKTQNNKVYTYYRLKNLTTRPSNSFKGVNYLALNKNGISRKSFIPQNDFLVEIDISAYHLKLCSFWIDYEFEQEDIHEYFSKLYNSTYKEAKTLSFKQLYGGVFKEYEHLEFFKKIKVLINKNWDLFNEQGYLETESGFRFYKKDLEGIKPQKLFNYILQEKETSYHIEVINKVLPLLLGKKSKIILYTYDSILIDFNNEDKNILPKIIQIYKNSKLNIKMKVGKNYKEMKEININKILN